MTSEERFIRLYAVRKQVHKKTLEQPFQKSIVAENASASSHTIAADDALTMEVRTY